MGDVPSRRALMLRMADGLPGAWEIDVEDLGNVYARERIQPCNACVSTSMALCCWPCNCYQKDDDAEPDLMWNLDLYARLDLANAWAIIGPHNWYGPSTNLKAMFDRLVCMSGGNPDETLIEHKNPELAMKLEHAPEWKELSANHLEGRTAAFFCYGDEGADEMDESGRPPSCGTRSGSTPTRSRSATRATRTRRSCGSAGTAASRCRIRSGDTAPPARSGRKARTSRST